LPARHVHRRPGLGDWRSVYIPTNAKGDDNVVRRNTPKIILNVVERWHYAGQFWIGIAAWPAIWQFYNMPCPTRGSSLLACLQRGPRTAKDETDLNVYLANHDKMPECLGLHRRRPAC